MVHPNALAPLLHLRLRNELDTTEKTKKKGKGRSRDDIKFKSDKRKEWMTKNMKKAMKEKKEIEKDLDEAAAEVDVEERASIVSTEVVCVLTSPANRNTEEPLRALFPHLEEPHAFTTPSRRS